MAKLSKRDQALLDRFHDDIQPRMYDYFGAKLTRKRTGEEGVTFRIWAPNAEAVAVVGDFNSWDPKRDRLHRVDDSGVWEGFVPGLTAGTGYKYCFTAPGGNTLLKMDPYGTRTSAPPQNDSVVEAPSAYVWQDAAWMEARQTLATGGRSTSTRCIWAAGAGMRTAACTPIGSWRIRCRTTWPGWATTIWS